jgi:hypothetical protein
MLLFLTHTKGSEKEQKRAVELAATLIHNHNRSGAAHLVHNSKHIYKNNYSRRKLHLITSFETKAIEALKA